MFFYDALLVLTYLVTIVFWCLYSRRIIGICFNETKSVFVKAIHWCIVAFLMLIPGVNTFILIGIYYSHIRKNK